MLLRTLLIALVLGLPLSQVPARASDLDDHDRARQALQAGEVLPLLSILRRVEQDYPGQIMEVELEQEDNRWIYEIKVLRRGGALVKLEIDARSGVVLGTRERKEKSRVKEGGR